MDERPTTVLLANHHAMFREGMAELLTSSGGSGSGRGDEQQPGALASRTKPNVVITQVQMPFEKTRETLDRIRAVEPTPKVVIVAKFEDPALTRTFLRPGASGYVLKSALSRQLAGEVRPAVFA